MKYIYKEFEMNGVIRIGEMQSAPDDAIGASIIYVDNLLDESGLECYKLINNEPVNVGARPRSQEEIEKAVNQRINSEFPQEKRDNLIELAMNCSLEGKSIPIEYKNYRDRKLAIRQEIEAVEASKTYTGKI